MTACGRSIAFSLFGLFLLSAHSSAVSAQGVVQLFVQIKGTQLGAWSEVFIRHREKQYKLDETGQNGRWEQPFTCELAMFVYARPKDWSLTTSREAPCKNGELVLEVERKAYANLLLKGLDKAELQRLSASAELGKLPESLEIAWKANDAAAVSQISNEIYDRLKAKPELANPEPFRVLALDAGLQAVGGAQGTLTKDPTTNFYKLPGSSVAQIKSLQSDKGLEQTGALDWKTLKAMTGKNLSDFYSTAYNPQDRGRF